MALVLLHYRGIEGERVKDLNMSTYLRICDWLNISPSDLIIEAEDIVPLEADVSDTIKWQLRAAKKLDPDTADLLSEMVKLAFERAEKKGVG